MFFSEIIYLKGKILSFLESNEDSLAPPTQEIIISALKEVLCLEEVMKRVTMVRSSSLDKCHEEIRVAVSKFEDLIETHVFYQNIESDSDIHGDGIQSSMDLDDLKVEIHSYSNRIEELHYLLREEEKEVDDDDDDVSSRITSSRHKVKMVGLSDQYNQLKRCLMQAVDFDGVVSLQGMPGIGKTTLAKEIFEDPDVSEFFDCRVWVNVGIECEWKEIPRLVLDEVVNPNSDNLCVEAGDRDEISRALKESLKGKRYLIVLDDVWDKYMAYRLRFPFGREKNEMGFPLPHEETGSRVLLTTRLQQKDDDSRLFPGDVITMRLLNKEESWDLLREEVFVGSPCPLVLEEAGKKIAENCVGLPLTIVTIAKLLSEVDKTEQCWSEIAAKRNHQLLIAAYDEISKVLLPSYNYLTQPLKMCFLYMGVFPPDQEIFRSKIITMWNVDGFLELNLQKSPRPCAEKFLEELVSNSLVMIHKRTTDATSPLGRKLIKTCSIHVSLWHLSIREARKAKFSHVLYSCDDGVGESVKSQQRLSFHNNILFNIKAVMKSVEDSCASTARSLLCYGPYHQYQVPICSNLKLLRELDALAIRFYEFPVEVLQLSELKYLALTLNGKLPVSISQLANLQFLIVGEHLSIKASRDPLYLPVEIWNMKELKHLQVMGSDLQDPCGKALENLSTLSNVSFHTCSQLIFKAIPNLKKLGILIELRPDGNNPMTCFDNISHLTRLKFLKCVVVNPEVVPPLAPLSKFPSFLTKLSLSGLSYPWEEMKKIVWLKCLKKLKLRNYAFRGPEWEVEEEGFPSLHSLVIDDTDLVEWRIGCRSFRWLKFLSLKCCYKLQRICGKFQIFLGSIEVIDCHPSSVEEMHKAISSRCATIDVQNLWDVVKLKT